MRPRPTLAAALLLALTGAATSRAGAAPRAPMTEIAAQAERAFDAEQWAEAAVALHRVASGETGDGAEQRKLAEYHLGIALHRLGFHHASLDVFRRIAADRSHPGYDKALLWLARLSAQLPDPAGVAGVVAAYSREEIARYDNPWQRDVASRLGWLSGRERFGERRWDEAADALAAVSPSGSDFARAQIFLGVAQAEQGRTAAAVVAFRRVLAAPGTGGQPDELHALARLSLGRLYLATAVQRDQDGTFRVDRRLLGAATRSLAAVDARSERWADGLLELSRALFLAGDAAGALGKAHEIEVPFTSGYEYPESALLRASIYHALCHDEDAREVASRFVALHEPVARDLKGLLERYTDGGAEPALYDLLHRVRSGKDDLVPATRRVVVSAVSDRETLRYLEHTRFVDEELARLRKAPVVLRESALYAAIEEGMRRDGERTVREGGAIVRRRLQRALAEVEDRLARARSIVAASARAVGGSAVAAAAQRVESRDEMGEVWRLDDETWHDEPGHYREAIDARCGAAEAKERRARAIGWMSPSPASEGSFHP